MNGRTGIIWSRVLTRAPLSLRSVLLSHNGLLTRSFSASDAPPSAVGNVGAIRHTPHLKRKLGQHLLVTEKILTQIVDAAELPALLQSKQAALEQSNLAGSLDQESSEKQQQEAIVRVLEIGPGTGNLTSALLNLAPNLHVHAVEFDVRMVERLNERFSNELLATKRLRLENIDFEDFQFAKEIEPPKPTSTRRVSIRGRGKARERATAAAAAAAEMESRHFDACVANIPYHLSSIIISRLSNYMFRFPDRLKCVVLLVQEEFAQRLLAKPGKQTYSRLSVNTALIADVVSVVPVGREHFLPPPKVDSRVIKLTPKPRQPSEGDAADVQLPEKGDKDRFFQRFDTLLRIGFLRKNKTLRAALLSNTATALMEKSTQNALSKEELKLRVEAALEASGLTSKRAVQLPVQDFKRCVFTTTIFLGEVV